MRRAWRFNRAGSWVTLEDRVNLPSFAAPCKGDANSPGGVARCNFCLGYGRIPRAPASRWKRVIARAASRLSIDTRRQSQGLQELRRQRKEVAVWLASDAWMAA